MIGCLSWTGCSHSVRSLTLGSDPLPPLPPLITQETSQMIVSAPFASV